MRARGQSQREGERERQKELIEEQRRKQDFNDAAEFPEGADRVGEDDDDRAPNWKERAKNMHRGQSGRRGKGYGYRRDEGAT